MIIKYPLASNEANELIRKFTVKNKNYDRLVKMKGYEMPYLRNIKLYNKDVYNAYFPIGQFNMLLKPSKFLKNKLVYNNNAPIKDGMQEMIKEQEIILNRIDFDGLRTGLISMKTGRGKCFGKGTKILMNDCSNKNIEEIKIGDTVMGPDGTERNVISTTKGIDTLYKIITYRSDEIVCNGSHILVLRYSYDYNGLGLGKHKKGDIIKISVDEYLKLCKLYPKKTKHLLKLIYSEGIDIDRGYNHIIEPYFLGYWLGNGTSLSSNITTMHSEVVNYLKGYADRLGLFLNKSETIENKFSRLDKSLISKLRKIGVIGNKYIPIEYIKTSKKNRLELLAGLLDSDGHYDKVCNRIIFTNTNESLVDGVLFIAKSVGLFAHKSKGRFTKAQNGTRCFSWNVSISGDLTIIPNKVKYKMGNMMGKGKINLNVGFTIKDIGRGEYYGFMLDGDHLFLLDSFIVSHNSIAIIKLIEHFQEKTLILVHNIKTLGEFKKKFQDFSNVVPGVYYSKKKDIQEITITTHKSFSQKPEEFAGKFGLLIYDEADCNNSDVMREAVIKSDVDGLFGFTGTPYRQELDTDDLILIFGPLLKVEGQDNNGYNMLPKILRYEAQSDICSYEHFNELYDQLMADEGRTAKQIDLIEYSMRSRKLGLVLVERKIECEKYCNLLLEKGISACIINGDTGETEDDVNIALMIKNRGVIVATSDKMSRGVDVPTIDTIYIFYPNKFQGNIVQAVGRGLRTLPGKEDVVVYDWIDAPILQHQGRERLRSYRREYGNIEIKSFTL